MAKKNNIRSIRFSDELAEMIDQQVGDTFTQKFENLITRCVWELPQKEEQIKKLDEEIKKKKEDLKILRDRCYQISNTIRKLSERTKRLEEIIDAEIREWNA